MTMEVDDAITTTNNNTENNNVGSSWVLNNENVNERVTRKGRRLARQGLSRPTTTTGTTTPPGAKSSDNHTRAATPNTTFFFQQHRAVNQPGEPEGSGFWQLTERSSRRERLQRHRREAAALSTQPSVNTAADTQGAQDSAITPTSGSQQTLTRPVVTGELVVDSQSDGWGDQRKRRVCCAILLVLCVVVASILGVSLPLTLATRSKDNSEKTPLPVPTGPPIERNTFAPSVTPGASSFVQFGPDIEGRDTLGLQGYSIAFVGERWLAVSVPRTETATGSVGLVRVWDTFNNRTQIGQDIEADSPLVSRFGEAISGSKDFLAVASNLEIHLLRYNETTGGWERVGPILDPDNFNEISDPLRTQWDIQALSMNQVSFLTNSTLIRLTVSMYSTLVQAGFVVVFTIDVSRSQPVWTKKGNTIVVERPVTVEAASVGDNVVVVGSAGQSGAITQAFLLQGDEWVEQSQFAESVLLGSRLLGISFFHKMNSTVVAYANAPDSSGIGRITVVEVGHDLSVASKGSPIPFLVETTSEWAKTKVVVNGEWLAWGGSYLGEFVGSVYRLEDGVWAKQGNDLL